MESYRISIRFRYLLSIVTLFALHHNILSLFSLLYDIENSHVHNSAFTTGLRRKLPLSIIKSSNIQFTRRVLYVSAKLVFALLSLLLLCILLSGDVHTGPYSQNSHSNTSPNTSTSSSNSSIDLSNHISFAHYNVQSVLSKLDYLYTELHDFDIIALSKTWLSGYIQFRFTLYFLSSS